MSSKIGEKRSYIVVTISSSSEDEYETEDSQSQSDSEYNSVEANEITSSSSSAYTDDDDDEGEIGGSCDRVIRRLQDKSDLLELKLRDCHSYLRHHGLRITGTKTECVERIMMHWRIKDGNAEALYPRSSFVVDCTGDVCRGDVVLFKQRVKMFNKRRSKQFPSIRTVAGRVVRESYGASAQQHTFTIEVLWSKACKGVEQLHLLSFLLVKGRKLYRMKTFRQLWKKEAERHQVLAEKHERGDAARLTRAMNRGMEQACSNKYKGIKRQKQALHATPSMPGRRADAKRGNRGRTKREKIKSTKHRQRASKENLKKKSKAKAPESSTKLLNPTHPRKKQCTIARSYPYPSQAFGQTQMHLNIPFYPHQHLQNYDTNSQFSHFPPQIFHQAQLHPYLPHHPHNYRDTNAQLYSYPPNNFHQPQTHHDIQALSRHPQNSQQSQMQFHHQPWNVNHVSPQYEGPPVIQASGNRSLNHDYNRSDKFDPGNASQSRLRGGW